MALVCELGWLACVTHGVRFLSSILWYASWLLNINSKINAMAPESVMLPDGCLRGKYSYEHSFQVKPRILVLVI